jgi:IS5 family transposase
LAPYSGLGKSNLSIEVFLDASYVGADKREKLKDRDVNWEIAMKRGKLKSVSEKSGVGQLPRNCTRCSPLPI